MSKALQRLASELRKFDQEKEKGEWNHVWLFPNEKDMTRMHALLIGPSDTPYAGALLYFELTFPTEYPFKNPGVKFLSPQISGNIHMRIHPNLYAEGKVCLSILGTWDGPPWTSAMGIATLMNNISGLLDENPIQKEPAYENTPANDKRAVKYRIATTYEVVKLACDLVYRTQIPTETLRVMREQFVKHYDIYMSQLEKIRAHDGEKIDGIHKGTKMDIDQLKKRVKDTLVYCTSKLEDGSNDNGDNADDNGDDNGEDGNDDSYDSEDDSYDSEDSDIEEIPVNPVKKVVPKKVTVKKVVTKKVVTKKAVKTK